MNKLLLAYILSDTDQIDPAFRWNIDGWLSAVMRKQSINQQPSSAAGVRYLRTTIDYQDEELDF